MDASLPSRPCNAPLDLEPRRYKDAGTFFDGMYIWEWCPSHPSAPSRGAVLQHRLVMEGVLGRFLTKRERVHHINHCSWDNRAQNLKLYASHQEHMLEHWQGAGRRSPEWIELVRLAAGDPSVAMSSVGLSPTTIRAICLENQIVWNARAYIGHGLSEESVRAALQGRTTQQAAKVLNVYVALPYSRFGHLLRKRASPGCLNPHKSEIVRLVWKERTPRTEIALRFGVSLPTVHGAIQWWSKEDARPDAPVPQRKPLQRHKPLPAHMRPRKA